MALNEKLKRELRGRGHALKPVVTIGNAGLSAAVMREIDLSLEHHELMKVKIASGDRAQRATTINTLCETLGAELVQSIGHIALIYRAPKD
jgi:RNA-binding protein